MEVSSTNKLQQLFLACDVRGTGLIGRTELQELCKSFSISPEDSDLIFDDLDRDEDGKINFEDFCRGFRDCINMDFSDVKRSMIEEEMLKNNASTSAIKYERKENVRKPKKRGVRRRDSMHHAFKQFSKTYGEENVLQYLGNSDEKIQQLYQELEAADTDPGLRAQVEGVLGSLINEVTRLQEDNNKMETMYLKEKDTHESHLRVMEEELEAHVSRVEAQARRDAELKKEQEMRSIQHKMQDEINELQMHLKMFQKVDSWLNKDTNKSDNEEALRKLEDATNENRGLKMNLTETETSIALMRAEMAQVRAQYEEKCRELHNERQQLEEYIVGQQQYQRQLHLLQDANRRIQDTNDSLRQTLQDGGSVTCRSSRRPATRPNSQLSSCLAAGGPASLSDELVDVNSWDTAEVDSVRSHGSRGRSQPPVEDVQYGIPRLMNDLNQSMKEQDEIDSGVERSLKDGVESPVDMILPEEADQIDAQQDNAIDEYTACTERRRIISANNSPRSARCRYLLSPTPSAMTASSVIMDRESGLEEARGPPERTYKVVFAGDAAVGKSTFITRLCKGIFLTNVTSTLGVDFQVKTLFLEGKNVAIQLWDTAGQERFRSITKSYFRRADGVMLLFDVSSERSYLSVRQWIQNIDEIAASRIPIMLCANKCDMRMQLIEEKKPCVSEEQGEKLAREFGAHYQETSAKTGYGMAAALIALGRRMVTNEDVEVQTSALKIGEDRKSSCSGGGSACRKQ